MNTNARERSASKSTPAPARPALRRSSREATPDHSAPKPAPTELAHSFTDVRVHSDSESPLARWPAAAGPRLDKTEGKDKEGGAGAGGAPETETVAGTLWAMGPDNKPLPPSIDDVKQGQVGDCYLFAALVAIVKTNPQDIVDMIQDNKDGTYTVTFKGIGVFSSSTQTVSATLPKGKHGYVAGRRAIWPLIIEAAYAKEKGGIDKIGKGGQPGVVIDDLLDEGASSFDPREKTADYIMGKIVTGIAKKYRMTISSPQKEGASAEKKTLAEGPTGLVFHHAYAIIDVDAKGNRIKLFNPWGNTHPNGDGWLDVNIAQKFFDKITINSD